MAEAASAKVLGFPSARLTRSEAELLAIAAVTYLGAEEGRLGRFLRVSGLEVATLRSAASSPAFLLGVLDYIAADEGLLRSFADSGEMHPTTIMVAREALAPALQVRTLSPEPSRSIAILCDACGNTVLRPRRDLPHAPAAAVRVRVPRCGPCGAGFDPVETWFDRRGNEVE